MRPVPIHERALDDIRYIRSALDTGAPFTAVSGVGGVAMGVVGLAAAAIAAPEVGHPQRWLSIWIGAAVLATIVGTIAMVRKSRQAGASLFSTPARRFALAFFPAIAAGAVLTLPLAGRGLFDLLPRLWLLLYGVAVCAGGAFSVRAVPLMGVALLATGVAVAFVPLSVANLLLGFGFGVVHVAGGVVIMRRYGG